MTALMEMEMVEMVVTMVMVTVVMLGVMGGDIEVVMVMMMMDTPMYFRHHTTTDEYDSKDASASGFFSTPTSAMAYLEVYHLKSKCLM